MAQAIRTLFAKIDHGSAKSVQQVIDRWGPGILLADHDAVMPGMSLWSVALESSRDSEQKFRLLLLHAPGYLPPQSTLVAWLNIAIKRSWTALLGDIFKRMNDMTPPPMSLEHMIIWMRSNPKLTDSLIKYCKRSREINESVGAYLYKAQLAEPNLDYLVQGNLTLTPDFDRLAKKAAERFSAQATH